MSYLKPFDIDLDGFLRGPSRKKLIVDPIFGRHFDQILLDYKHHAPDEIIPLENRFSTSSVINPEFSYQECPVGILLYGPNGLPVGGSRGRAGISKMFK